MPVVPITGGQGPGASPTAPSPKPAPTVFNLMALAQMSREGRLTSTQPQAPSGNVPGK